MKLLTVIVLPELSVNLSIFFIFTTTFNSFVKSTTEGRFVEGWKLFNVIIPDWQFYSIFLDGFCGLSKHFIFLFIMYLWASSKLKKD
ncbi:hypothetical protein CDL12_10380 [Handroanthus impetiginosus]|uniref:Uncharacterized protein n=1 Tax=Handroanthus impetiginosus TaxID=429701 RepID=A0A2G9HHJ0_9LAMI|nr:hypothetical protein CDL12_10380 [Handroanthus impetiginosus]